MGAADSSIGKVLADDRRDTAAKGNDSGRAICPGLPGFQLADDTRESESRD
jgi:hypothetical protein